MQTIMKSVRYHQKLIFNRFKHMGDRYSCPICSSDIDRFLPHGITSSVFEANDVVGGGYRELGICPACNSTDRERLVYLFIKNELDLLGSGKRVLHVAPDPGLDRILSREPKIEYVTADLMAQNVMVKMDVTDIEFPDDTFDCILCNHVLEHVPNDLQAMRELRRVLKPGGVAILQTPIAYSRKRTYEDSSITSREDRILAFGQFDHVRLYGIDYFNRLSDAGFAVDPFDWKTADADYGMPDNRYGLNENELMVAAVKPLLS